MGAAQDRRGRARHGLASLLCSLALAACDGHERAEPPADPQPRVDVAAPLPERATAAATESETPPATPSATPPASPKPAPPADPQPRWARAGQCDAPPLALTTSDGAGLKLTSLQARAVIQGPLAFTELQLEFENPAARVLEGRFEITLPDRAAVSRLAMELDGRWQEGEVVERQAARVAYEDFLHRAQDPALLEQGAGNKVSARVFPIPARGRKRLIVSYSEELPELDQPWRLTLCGLPQLAALDVDVWLEGQATGDAPRDGERRQHVAVHELALAPDRDLEVSRGAAGAIAGLRSGELVVARVTPALELPSRPLRALTVLLDTSASRALDQDGQLARLRTLLERLSEATGGQLELRVLAFDQDAHEIYRGVASGFGEAQLAQLRARGAMGASNLERALGQLATSGGLHPRLLLVSDGVLTAGETEAGPLRERLAALAELGLERVDALVDGADSSRALLESLTTAGLAEDGVLIDARMDPAEQVQRLARGTRSGIAVDIPGARWSWPKTLDGVQPGDSRLVYAALSEEHAEDPTITLALTGAAAERVELPLVEVEAPLVRRAHARARVAALELELEREEDEAARSALADEIVALSTSRRVLSKRTALLVLETEADYRRFGIARDALVDILAVGERGLELRGRGGTTPVVLRDRPRARRPAAPDVSPAGAVDPGLQGDAVGVAGGIPGGIPGGVVGGVVGGVLGGVASSPHISSSEGYGRGAGSGVSVRRAAAQVVERRELAYEDANTINGEALATAAPSSAAANPAPASGAAEESPPVRARQEPSRARARREPPKKPRPKPNAWTGEFAVIKRLLRQGRVDEAVASARAWRKRQPGDVLALTILGEALARAGEREEAARAYGSLIDLYPTRADIRRMAGERLETLEGDGLGLAIDTYARAVEQRADHPSSHRLHAWALARAGRHEEAFAAIERAMDQDYPEERFPGLQRILREDLGILGAAWLARAPAREPEIQARVRARYTRINHRPSTRFMLSWESDANDVDLHVWDKHDNHAYFSELALASGGALIADVTTGYGPECFTMYGRRSAYPYRLMVHYYRRGPMGYGMGTVQIVQHDGAGELRFDARPFVIMRDDAWAELVTLRHPLPAASRPGAP